MTEEQERTTDALACRTGAAYCNEVQLVTDGWGRVFYVLPNGDAMRIEKRELFKFRQFQLSVYGRGAVA